jgi:hypothetical protein
MPATVRLATNADVDAMVRLHLGTFSPAEHLGSLLGPAFVRASYVWHVTDESAYVLVAELGDALVGLLGMCDRSFTGPMLRGCARTLVAALGRRPKLLIDRRLWARLARANASPDWVKRFCATAGVAQMSIGAVDANLRGRSVFSTLIGSCEAMSRQRGLVAIRAGVYRSNSQCQRAFQRNGWTEVDALACDETVYFVRVLNPDLLTTFPELVQANGVCPRRPNR